MIVVAKDDVIRGLKRAKRLAKQDLLASSQTSDPTFWENQAVARREKYTQLMDSIEKYGVDAACKMALSEYAVLPLSDSPDQEVSPDVSGYEQALDMFFVIVGIDEKARLQKQGESSYEVSSTDAAIPAIS